MTRRASFLLVVLAAACSDDKPHARTATLAEAKVAIEVKDAGAGPRPTDAPAEEPEAAARGGGLPPGKEWLPGPDLGVDLAVSSSAELAVPSGREVVVKDGTSELRLRRTQRPSAADRDAIIARLTREGGGTIGIIANHAEGEEFRIEYVIKDRKSGQPRFGLVMRRLIDGRAIDCTSRGPETGSTAMALEACHAMRATPH